MNIVIVTTGHPPFDERIFYKFGISLKDSGHNVCIICSTKEITTEVEGISVRGFEDKFLPKQEKIGRLFAGIALFKPSLIICCEPLPILAARKYKKEILHEVKIIYDITEFYPHQNMLNNYYGLTRIMHYLRFSVFNAYVSNLADYLFIGEKGKAKLYNIIVPSGKKFIIGYYPPQKYFHYSPPGYDGKNFTLCYTGNISKERGFIRFVNIVKKVAARYNHKFFTAKIIGHAQDDFSGLISELSDIKNIKVIQTDQVDYKYYSSEFEGVDLCIDLRDKNNVFNRSLPIKIFDYIASGKPFVFSDLKSFKGFEDLKEAGIMIDPDDIDSAVQQIYLYLDNPDKLRKDSQIAFRLFQEKYNWEIIESKMIDIINALIRKR